MALRVASTAHGRALGLLGALRNHPPSCPCHSNPFPSIPDRRLATPVDGGAGLKEYAFEMAASNIRYGPGVTKEVGMDFANLGSKRVAVITDGNVGKLTAVAQAIAGLEKEGIAYEIFSDVRVEPKDSSIKRAVEFAKKYDPDAYLAVGGGSVIDTAKLANLYHTFPEADFLDFVNAPLGRGLPITKPLKPLIAVPTTAGTGSETTGTAIFDLESKHAKTGIAHRNMKPLLGVVDPLNTRSMPMAVHVSSGLDVLCHSLESWTAIPYNERTPRPTNPINRPAYQGANPISDIFSLAALRMTVEYLPRVYADPNDHEAQAQMLLAATLAGVGFGNAGVHLCHGMSYPLAGMNKSYRHPGYDIPAGHVILPHGVSVAVTAPAVFRFTGASNPDRHLQAARIFGYEGTAKAESAGEILAECLQDFLVKLNQPRGICKFGYGAEDIGALVEGTLPQQRVLMLAPSIPRAMEEQRDDLTRLFENSLSY